MLSIVVPVYNVERYLRRCIESVLMQSCADWELILVDDGSKDSSGAICDEYAARDGRIRVIHKENEGVSVARNVGIEAAKGEFISFIDSDDWVGETYCATILESMEGCDLLYFGNECLLTNGEKEFHAPKEVEAEGHQEVEKAILDLKRDKTFEFFGYTWNKCFRRSILEEYGVRFEKGLAFREDDLFASLYVPYVCSMKIISDSLYVYRMSQVGLTYSASKSGALLKFADLLRGSVDSLQNDDLQNHEYARIADTIFYAAKLDSSIRNDVYGKLLQFVQAHSDAPYTMQLRFVFSDVVLSRVKFSALLLLWDVKSLFRR